MNEWLKNLKKAMSGDGTSQATIMTLATLSLKGSPRARCVVCRDIDRVGVIWFVSDARSKKNEQIRQSRAVETVFWFAGVKQQFRVRGEARIATPDDPKALQLWRALPE